MSINEAVEILKKDFDINNHGKYKQIQQLFFNNQNCACNSVDIYKKVKSFATDNNYFKNEEMNKKQPKNEATGKFTKTVEKPEVIHNQTNINNISTSIDTTYIFEVKQEIIQGYMNMDKITKAYQLITKTDAVANIAVMRRTILNYN